MKISAALITISLILFVTSNAPSALNGPVAQALITTGVSESAQPMTDHLTVVDQDIGHIVFYTEIVGFTGETIFHQWLYNEKPTASISLSVRSEHSINWSKHTIGHEQVGHWEARVVDQHGNVLVSRHFDVVASGRSMEQIIQEKQVDSCKVKLAELRKKMEANPDIDYFRFIFEKQLLRCQ